MIFENSGLTFIGTAGWCPMNNYTEGVWENIQFSRSGNPGGESKVLYWMQQYNKVPIAINTDYNELLEIKK